VDIALPSADSLSQGYSDYSDYSGTFAGTCYATRAQLRREVSAGPPQSGRHNMDSLAELVVKPHQRICVLAQLRTGMARLNGYLRHIGAVDTD
jgi:hypothetical protein